MKLSTVALEKEILIIKERKKENWCKNFFLSCINRLYWHLEFLPPVQLRIFQHTTLQTLFTFLKLLFNLYPYTGDCKENCSHWYILLQMPCIHTIQIITQFFLLKEFLKYTIFIVTFYYNYCSIMQKIQYLPLDKKCF